MGLWSKGLKRARTGVLRKEEGIYTLIEHLTNFINGVLSGRCTINVVDNIWYVHLSVFINLRFEPTQNSHLNVMEHFLKHLDYLLIYKRDINNLFVLRDKTNRNINLYKETGKLEDLYFI